MFKKCLEDDVKSGFGLMQPKIEGHVHLFDNPDGIEPWKEYSGEFVTHFEGLWGRWYLRPFEKFLFKVAKRAWDQALYINAKERGV